MHEALADHPSAQVLHSNCTGKGWSPHQVVSSLRANTMSDLHLYSLRSPQCFAHSRHQINGSPQLTVLSRLKTGKNRGEAVLHRVESTVHRRQSGGENSKTQRRESKRGNFENYSSGWSVGLSANPSKRLDTSHFLDTAVVAVFSHSRNLSRSLLLHPHPPNQSHRNWDFGASVHSHTGRRGRAGGVGSPCTQPATPPLSMSETHFSSGSTEAKSSLKLPQQLLHFYKGQPIILFFIEDC